MQLSNAQLEQFDRDGLLILPDLFSGEEVAAMTEALGEAMREDTPANVREKFSGEVRTAMGLHQRSELFRKLVRHPRLIGPARQLLDEDFYAQQVKVNIKAAFDGEAWQWHYDFATHTHDDGVPKPLALNLHIFLDDVDEFNGPLHFIRGSHREGPAPTVLDTETTSYRLWVAQREAVARLVKEHGLISAKGRAGTVLIFGDCLVHASPPNLSPNSRRIFSLIVNPVSNRQTKLARPPYMHDRDFEVLRPEPDDCLQPATAAA